MILWIEFIFFVSLGTLNNNQTTKTTLKLPLRSRDEGRTININDIAFKIGENYEGSIYT